MATSEEQAGNNSELAVLKSKLKWKAGYPTTQSDYRTTPNYHNFAGIQAANCYVCVV